MRIKTQSGSVRINMGKGIIDWPAASDNANRTFETSINTHSGSVNGDILAGNGGLTTIETSSGSIKLHVEVLDIGPKDNTSRLETITGSGSQGISVTSLSAHELRNLEALHLVRQSGSARVQYPTSWQGKLHMQSMGSGSMKASGYGLQFAQDGDREKFAWRGHGDLKDVEVIERGSGSARFSC